MLLGVDCGNLTPPEHGNIKLSDGTTFSSFATYTCVPPFQLAGSAVRVCQASRVWSGTAPLCESLQCPSLGDPADGRVTVNGNLPGDTATYVCSAGFTLMGTETRSCLSNGFWSGGAPQCKRKWIPVPARTQYCVSNVYK